MIEVSVVINKRQAIANMVAKRIEPIGRAINEGEICIYELRVGMAHVDTIKFPYGCGIELAKKMLELYKENEAKYKLLALARSIERKII